jgi:predicted molibdopterin-dependent oxidoreductase YjgC
MNKSVIIDGQTIELTPFDNNVIEMISRANIKIPAPCYRTKQIKGCCSVCVVEIGGEQKFACSTIPQHGMNIIVDRADLRAIRKQRLLEYKESIKGEK